MRNLAAKLAVAGAAAAVVLGMVAGSASASFSLKGAGSTLIQPMLANVWIPDFQSANSGDTVSYPGGGSTAGINDATANTVNFGASDAPMTAAQLSGCPKCVQIPWALSATGPVFNLGSGGPTTLNFSGSVLGGIFLGTITKWNDPAIAKLNPGVTLPSAPIAVFYRSDGSGDTFVWESFLADTDPAYASFLQSKNAVPSTSFLFNAGTGEKSNSGVATSISNTPDSIGYVSTFYVKQSGIPNLHGGAVENASGKFIHPYPPSMTDAAAQVPASDLTTSNYNTEPVIANIVAKVAYKAPKVKKGHKAPKLSKAQKAKDLAIENLYPLSTFTDVIVRSDSSDVADLQTFIEFCLSSAEQAKGPGQSFAPLPAAIVTFDLAQIKAL